MTKKIVILGASANPDRYANRAQRMLSAHGFDVIPVNLRESIIEGVAVQKRLGEIEEEIDTIAVYLNPALSTPLADDIIGLSPRRVIFNPGAENRDLASRLRDCGIVTEEACTLVLLQTGQF